ncbi:hypothetical protein PENTCL1PPCAC_24337, partial [Pristionchus entomophagus]
QQSSETETAAYTTYNDEIVLPLRPECNNAKKHAEEEMKRMKRIITIFSIIFPLGNAANILIQYIDDSTAELRIEAWLPLIPAVLFLLYWISLSSNSFDVHSTTEGRIILMIGIVLTFMSFIFLMVIGIHGGQILKTHIAKDQDISISLIVLLVLTAIEFGIRFFFARVCWKFYVLHMKL